MQGVRTPYRTTERTNGNKNEWLKKREGGERLQRCYKTTHHAAHLLSVAGLALVALVDDLTLAAAGGASALELLHHAGTDLSELDLSSADYKTRKHGVNEKEKNCTRV